MREVGNVPRTFYRRLCSHRRPHRTSTATRLNRSSHHERHHKRSFCASLRDEAVGPRCTASSARIRRMIRETLLSTAPAQSVAPTAAANWSPAAGASRVVQIIGSSSAIPRSSVRAARPGVFGSSWARLNSEACAHCAARRCWAWRCDDQPVRAHHRQHRGHHQQHPHPNCGRRPAHH
jgi:hypothetical protein